MDESPVRNVHNALMCTLYGFVLNHHAMRDRGTVLLGSCFWLHVWSGVVLQQAPEDNEEEQARRAFLTCTRGPSPPHPPLLAVTLLFSTGLVPRCVVSKRLSRVIYISFCFYSWCPLSRVQFLGATVSGDSLMKSSGPCAGRGQTPRGQRNIV